MSYDYRSISRQDARRIQKQNKLLKIVIAILATITIFSLAFAYNMYEGLKMNKYAMEHNCTWYSSYYINEQPVCK